MTYHFGVFEDGLFQRPDTFPATVAELKSLNMNAICFTNSTLTDLAAADAAGIRVIAAPMTPLYQHWYNKPAADLRIEDLRALMAPVIDQYKDHPSLLAYNVHDDTPLIHIPHLKLVKQVFKERDLLHPALPMLVTTRQGQGVFDAVKPEAYLGYLNSFRNPPMSPVRHWIEVFRQNYQLRSPGTPLYVSVQCHPIGGVQPTPQQLVQQLWTMVGEGATGLFIFVWTTQAGAWTGLKDLSEHKKAAAAFGAQLRTLEPVLAQLTKVADRFRSTSYTSTFRHTDGSLYVLVVNESNEKRDLTIHSDYFDGKLRDVLTGEERSLGLTLPFEGGEGRLLRLLQRSSKRLPPAAVNLLPVQAHTASNSPGAKYVPITLKPDTAYAFAGRIAGQNLSGGEIAIHIQQKQTDSFLALQLQYPMWGNPDRTLHGWFRSTANATLADLVLAWVLQPGQSVTFSNLLVYEVGQHSPDEYLGELPMTPAQQAQNDLNALNVSVPALVADFDAQAAQIAQLTADLAAANALSAPLITAIDALYALAHS